MKKQNSRLFTFLLGLTAMFLVACGGDMQKGGEEGAGAESGNTENTEAAASMDMAKVLDAYFNIKNALVSSDAATAMIAANTLANETTGDLQQTAMAVKSGADIVAKREAFEKLSQQLYDLVKQNGGNKATVYKQFCPMAFNNKGAFWLSESSDIKNPYFGDEMLTCGNVQEELAAK